MRKGHSNRQLTLDVGGTPELPRLRPLLKWAGGKRWLVKDLIPLWKPYQHLRLVEPLCGGLSVALGLRPKTALLNDINPHLINFYRRVKRGFSLDISLKNEKRAYYANRREFNELIAAGNADTKIAAQLFYYLNHTCFNGLCRFNRKGRFNVPMGRYKIINYQRDWDLYKRAFANWEFTSKNFSNVNRRQTDFVYADPPYDKVFNDYSPDGFNWDQHQRLAKWLTQHRGPVVISNNVTKRVMELYDRLGFKTKVLQKIWFISANGDRKPADELLATLNL